MNKLILELIKARLKNVDWWKLGRYAAVAALASAQAAYQLKPSWPEVTWAGIGGAAIAAWNFLVNPEKSLTESSGDNNPQGGEDELG